MLELFRAFFRITEQDSEQAAREKIAGRMLLLDEALRDALPLAVRLPRRAGPRAPAAADGARGSGSASSSRSSSA